MDLTNTSNQSEKIYGVIGAGSFGTAIANMLAENGKVLIYMRRKEVYDNFIAGENRGQKIHPKVEPTQNLEDLCSKCDLIFPVVSSSGFRSMMKSASPYLRPDHILIHCTKGLNLVSSSGKEFKPGDPIAGSDIRTMSEIMKEESVVVRLGCLSGPNLSRELAEGQPAATVIASKFNEVIELGKDALKSNRFRVYGSYDLVGIELAGVLKNIMAVASGLCNGLGLGENAKAMLITRGLGEMIKVAKVLGADTKAFFGLAGIGDLIATCSSNLSRNFTVGYRLATGSSLEQILEEMNEVVEGINTIKLAEGICRQYKIEAPIVNALFNVLFNNQGIPEAINSLMQHEFDEDVDFL